MHLTPLFRTIQCGKPDIVSNFLLLSSAKADVNTLCFGLAPLHKAAEWARADLIDILINAGADVNIRSTCDQDGETGNTPLHLLASSNTNFENRLVCLEILKGAGANVHATNSDGQTALHKASLKVGYESTVACGGVDAELVKALIRSGCDPLQQDDYGRTPLQYGWSEVKEDEEYYHMSPHVITALVTAGDRSWECVPTPCPGLEAAMLSVWQNAREELPELYARLENPPPSCML